MRRLMEPLRCWPAGRQPTAPSRADIEAAATLIGGRVRRTPVVDLEYAPGCTATLKLELLQHTGSFKPRGAFTSVLSAPSTPERLVAASGGNHGLAVAHVGRVTGIRTDVFVPRSAPAVKVAGIRARGAEVHLVGATYAEAREASSAFAADQGAFVVSAYDSAPTVTGQGTLGREIEEQAPDADTILVAVGGGGLMGGVAAWWADRASIVAVEPHGCPTLYAAMQAGEPVTVQVGGLASDSLGASRIGAIGFEAARRAGAVAVLVPPGDIVAARELLWRELRVAAEPGGAAALAALLSGAYVPREGERVVVIVCGGNADPSDLPLG